MRACAENLSALYGQVRHAAQTLHAQATEIHELTKRLESLTKNTPACMPARGAKWKRGRGRERTTPTEIAPLNCPANCASYPAPMIPR
jgi:hypothetical protein